MIKALHNVRDQATDLRKVSKDVEKSCEEASESQEQGVSLLNAKTATLLRYNLNLAKLALARVKGESISALATKLVEDGVALSKLRPLEKKLQHHIELLLKGAYQNDGIGGDIAKGPLRPNPSAVVFDDEDDGDGDGDGADNAKRGDGDDVYRPPRLAEVVYDASAVRKRERKELEKERFQERALRNEGVREMVAELKGLPEEVHTGLHGNGSKSARDVEKLVREDAQRRRYEEDNFMRLNVTKKDRKRRRDVERAVETSAFDVSNEFSGLSAMADRVMGRKSKKSKSKSQVDDADEQYKMRKLEEAMEASD